jgi:Uma2 family endonuclease
MPQEPLMSTLAQRLGIQDQVSVEQYDEMIKQGILTPEDRIQLIGGRLVEMAPMGAEHAAQVQKLNKRINSAVEHHNDGKNPEQQVVVRPRLPLVLDGNSEPEPDIALVRMDMDNLDDGYVERHPRAEDAFLVIEVSDTTLRSDREAKLPRYAASGVPEVWIVDMTNRPVTVHRTPVDGRYTAVSTLSAGEITPRQIPGLTLKLEDFLVRSRARSPATRRER